MFNACHLKKGLMKNIFLITFSLSVYFIALFIAHYVFVTLPNRENTELKQEVMLLKADVVGLESRLESVESSSKTEALSGLSHSERLLQESEEDREDELETDCEINGGIYQGGGVCLFD